jgi:hypothetical protein
MNRECLFSGSVDPETIAYEARFQENPMLTVEQ